MAGKDGAAGGEGRGKSRGRVNECGSEGGDVRKAEEVVDAGPLVIRIRKQPKTIRSIRQKTKVRWGEERSGPSVAADSLLGLSARRGSRTRGITG